MFKLPFINNNKTPKTNADFYFGILLKEDKANCFLIKKNYPKFEIIDEILITYSNGWENLTEDVDEAISLLEQRNKASLKSTIIFIYSHFIDGVTGKIKKIYFDKIKSLLKDLELKPLGYIECYEGVIDALSAGEGLIVNTVLLELDLTQLTLFVFKNSKKVFSTVIPRTEDIANDILTGLGNLQEKILLPSRLLLYDSGNLSDEAAKIVSFHWPENYFIQPPKVEVINQAKLREQLLRVFQKQVIEEEKPLIEETVVEEQKSETSEAEAMGFKIGQDVALQAKTQSVETGHAPSLQSHDVPVQSNKSGFRFPLKIKLPKFSMSFSNWQTKIYFSIGIILIVGAGVANEYFLHKSDITVYLPSQKIEKQITLNKDELKIATFSGDIKLSQTTTGKKDIGEKAKGEVTVYNYDDQVKTFAKGTVIAVDSLKYVLEADVKVDAAKIAEDMAKLPGKNKVQVSAGDIGPEYNLEKGKKLKVADTSYFAINENALIGGTKKTIKTVAKKDLESLKADALKKAQAEQDSLMKLNEGERAINQLSEVNLGDSQYSKEVGEEGDSVSLTAKSMLTVYYYQDKEMLKLLEEKIAAEINPGFKLTPDQISFQLDKIEKNDINLSLTAKAMKDVKGDEVVKAVVFKNKDQLETILKDKFSAQGLIVKIKEPLPLLNNYTSPFSKNNSIQLVGN